MSVIRISSLVIKIAAMLFASSAFAATAQEKAAEKAAFVLNASADEVKATDIKRSGIKITYKAHYAGGVYNCYYTNVGISSDALCSGPINAVASAPAPAPAPKQTNKKAQKAEAPKTSAEKTAAKKAAFALNASADEVKVTEVKRSGIKITYQAHYSGGIYNCYYTNVGIASDALCSGPINDNPNAPKPHSGAGCNALLKAAGRCE